MFCCRCCYCCCCCCYWFCWFNHTIRICVYFICSMNATTTFVLGIEIIIRYILSWIRRRYERETHNLTVIRFKYVQHFFDIHLSSSTVRKLRRNLHLKPIYNEKNTTAHVYNRPFGIIPIGNWNDFQILIRSHISF